MAKGSNLPLGAEAVKAWEGGAQLTGKGDAIALRALLEADWLAERIAVVESKAGVTRDPFYLIDYAFPPRKPDGTADGLLRSAMLAAILRDVFAVEGEASNAVKQGFSRVYPAAVAIRNLHDGQVTVNNRNVIRMPLGMAVTLVTDDGKPNERGRAAIAAIKAAEALNGREVTDEEALAKAQAWPIDCTGERHPSFGKLPGQTEAVRLLKAQAVNAGLVARPAQRASRASADSDGQRFREAIAFIRNVLQEIRDTDEASIAFTDEMRHNLFGLASDIATYFASDPLEAEERKRA